MAFQNENCKFRLAVTLTGLVGFDYKASITPDILTQNVAAIVDAT